MRPLLALALVLFASPALASAVLASTDGAVRRYDFEVFRNGSPIGRHVATVTELSGETRVKVEIDLAVTFGPITLYRYRHRANEQWREGRLVFLAAETDDDGTKRSLKAEAEDGRIVLRGAEGRQTAPADAVPSSYWNPALRRATRWIETNWGEAVPVSVTPRAPVKVAWRGREVEAVPHHIKSERADLTVLYTPEGEWVGLTFDLWGGSFVYVRRETP